MDEYMEQEQNNVREEHSRKRVRKGHKLRNAIIAGVVVVGVGVSGTLVYFNMDNKTPNFTVPAHQIVSSISDSTVFDEAIEIVNAEAIDELDSLGEIVELSERLHSLDLNKKIGNLAHYEMPSEFSVDDVNALIDQYQELAQQENVKNGVLSEEDREFTKLTLTLEAYERSVNGTLSNDAYQTLVNYGIPCVKSKVLDACGFAAGEISNMRIGAGNNSYLITFNDTETDKEYIIKAHDSNPFSSTGYVHDVIESIYDWQTKSANQTDTGTSYDGKRNDDIKKGINSLKTLTLMNCEIDKNGEIKVTSKMEEVREKVKTLTQDIPSNNE